MSLLLDFVPAGYPLYLLSYALDSLETAFGRLYPSLHPKYHNLSERTVIVTGANVGIGLETARMLAEMGAAVVLACRDKEKGERARLDIIDSSRGKIGDSKVEVMVLDCGDLDSVRTFVQNWGGRRLDILVNNAGMSTGTYKKSHQGFETTYTTNFLSQLLLSILLLPNLSKYGRIVNVSSNGNYHIYPTSLGADDLDYSRHMEDEWKLKEGEKLTPEQTLELYRRTKLMQIWFTRELQRRLDVSETYKANEITVHCCHPGFVSTSLISREDTINFSPMLRKVAEAGFRHVAVAAREGACTPVHLATSEEVAVKKGLYWTRMTVRSPNYVVDNEKVWDGVWQKWEDQCRIEDRQKL